MTNKHENKYENLVIHCKSKEEWDWVFDNLPEGYSDLGGIKNINFTPDYSGLYLHTCKVSYGGGSFYTSKLYANRNDPFRVKAIISFQEYKQMILQDRQEECNSYQPPFANKHSHKTLEILSKNIATFTKAAKLAGIEENELDNYSKLLIELSAGGVELSWTFHPNL